MPNTIRTHSCIIIFAILSLMSGPFAAAQTSSISPYSRFGIGEIIPEGFAVQSGMGGIGAAYWSSTSINFINPACYVADTNAIFDFGARGEIRNIQSTSDQNTLNSATFSHLALAFPIKKNKISASFGLVPYSSVGYNVVDIQDAAGIENVRYEYQGRGGFHKFFLGTGFNLSKRLSAGVNLSYLFGTIEQIKNVEFPEQQFYFSSRFVNGVTARGIYVNYGVLYHIGTRNGLDWRAGFAGSLSTKVNAENNVYYYNYSISPVSGGEIIKDSVINEQTERSNIRLPQYLRGGISIVKPGKWLLGADASYYDWSRYENFGSEDPINNNYSINAGYERYREKSAYRFGINYGTYYLNLNNTALNEVGVSFGVSIKKNYSKRPPTVASISLEAGKRGTTANNLIAENYLKFTLGITMADIWFIKPRYE